MQFLYFQKLFSACPQNNWIVLNDTCYKFQNKILSFNDASNFCTNLGGKIFEPRNNFTDDQVYKSAKQNMNLNHGAWIGVISNHTVHWTGKKIFHGVLLRIHAVLVISNGKNS